MCVHMAQWNRYLEILTKGFAIGDVVGDPAEAGAQVFSIERETLEPLIHAG